MKKVWKVALLLSFLATCLMSCSRLFEDDEDLGNRGGGGRTSVDGRYVNSPNDTPLEDVLKDAGLFDGTKITSGTLPAGFLVKTPTGTQYVPVKSDGTLDYSNLPTWDKKIPLGSTITSQPVPASNKQLLVYTVTDLNGNTHQVPVEADSGKNATWPEIIQAAKDKGITIGKTPSGYTGDWKSNGSNLDPNDTTTQISPNQPITPDFTKSIKYTVGADTITVSVKYPETEATWEQIKTAAKAQVPGFDENLLWKDGNGKLVSSPKKYPAGTSFTSSTSTNAATGGSADRVVTVDKTNRTPEVGDKLYKDPNGKGWIIAKADLSKDGVTGWTLLGHVYDVDTTTGIVKIVSAKIDKKPWANSGAVYQGVVGTIVEHKDPNDPQGSEKTVSGTEQAKLSYYLKNLSTQDGYHAWLSIGGDFEIKNGKVINRGDTRETEVTSKLYVLGDHWNPDAIFRNYTAISWSLCYPNTSAIPNTTCFKPEVVKIVTGSTVESRWYLPSVAELTKIRANGPSLLNWNDADNNKKLSDKNFWSVEVSENSNTNAKRLNFAGNSGAEEVDKANNDTWVLAVAQFNYTTM